MGDSGSRDRFRTLIGAIPVRSQNRIRGAMCPSGKPKRLRRRGGQERDGPALAGIAIDSTVQLRRNGTVLRVAENARTGLFDPSHVMRELYNGTATVFYATCGHV